MVAGRSPEVRNVTVTTTVTSPNLTAPAGTFNEEDAGRPISGTGIPANTTLLTITSPTAAVMSASATAAGTVTAAIGSATTMGTARESYGFTGWSPESDTESESWSVSAVNASTATPDQITNPFTSVTQRSRG